MRHSHCTAAVISVPLMVFNECAEEEGMSWWDVAPTTLTVSTFLDHHVAIARFAQERIRVYSKVTSG